MAVSRSDVLGPSVRPEPKLSFPGQEGWSVGTPLGRAQDAEVWSTLICTQMTRLKLHGLEELETELNQSRNLFADSASNSVVATHTSE